LVLVPSGFFPGRFGQAADHNFHATPAFARRPAAEIAVRRKISYDIDLLPGASTQVKEMANGMVKHDKGESILASPSQAPSVGYQPQQTLAGEHRSLQAKIEPANTGINEAVVVGYGRQKEGAVTGRCGMRR